MHHRGETLRGAVPEFAESRQMRVAAELEHEHHEHQERHEEVQAVELRDAGEHERDYRNAAVRIAELARKKEARKDVKYARGKCGRRHDGHEPLVVRHVGKRVRTAQVEHHDVYACKEPKPVDCGEIRVLLRGLCQCGVCHRRPKSRKKDPEAELRGTLGVWITVLY